MPALPDPVKFSSYGQLTVLSETDKTVGGRRVLCRCSCGTEKLFFWGNVLRGHTKSCGCSHRKSGKARHDWTGYGDISGSYWYRVTSRESKKGDATIEDAWRIFQDQLGLCALSGTKLSFKEKTASLDRIDSSKGYDVDNIQWVHKDINRMKNAFDQDYFLAMCRRITECAKV